jgi:hypothetical protein
MFAKLFTASLFIVSAVPAGAASYAATQASPVQSRVIARDISWNCAGTACAGATAESRPLVLCQGLAKQAGPIGDFRVDGRPLSADQLERCNALARPGTAPQLARK